MSPQVVCMVFLSISRIRLVLQSSIGFLPNENIDVSRDDIGDHMKAYAEEKGIMNQKRKCLIGSMYGDKIMVVSPLLKWYVVHGLRVTQTHHVVEYTPDSRNSETRSVKLGPLEMLIQRRR